MRPCCAEPGRGLPQAGQARLCERGLVLRGDALQLGGGLGVSGGQLLVRARLRLEAALHRRGRVLGQRRHLACRAARALPLSATCTPWSPCYQARRREPERQCKLSCNIFDALVGAVWFGIASAAHGFGS